MPFFPCGQYFALAGSSPSSTPTSLGDVALTGVMTLSSSARILLPDGSAALPSIGFTSDDDSGIRWSSGMVLQFGAATVATIQSAKVTVATGAQIMLPDGTAANPAIAFTSDVDTGAYFASSQLRLGHSGSVVAAVGLGQFLLPDGQVGTPSLAYISDTDTGLYRSGADEFRSVAGGASRIIHSSASGSSGTWFANGNLTANAILVSAAGTRQLVTYKTGNYTLSASADSYVIFDGAGLTATLPTNPTEGTTFTICNADAGNLTVAAGAGDAIDASALATIPSNGTCTYVFRTTGRLWYGA